MNVLRTKANRYGESQLIVCALLVTLNLFNYCHAQQVETPQKMVEQWLSLERQASQVESDWLSQKPLLEQRLLLLQAEKQQLTSVLNESSTDFGQVEQKRHTLVQEQSLLESAQHHLEKSLNYLQQQLIPLQASLAPPISHTWQQENSQLNTDAQTSQQLQISLAQLTKLAEFDQRISVIQAPIKNTLGEDIIVKQLFIGAGFGWFVSLDGSYVGSGQVRDGVWQWQFDHTIDSQKITQAIAMFEKSAEADLVHLPIHLAALENK